jgi:hypothetical protein
MEIQAFLDESFGAGFGKNQATRRREGGQPGGGGGPRRHALPDEMRFNARLKSAPESKPRKQPEKLACGAAFH